jgi:hypothetical protein
MKDYALQLYSETIENIQMDRIIQPLQDVIYEMTETENTAYAMKPLEQGWALPPKKTRSLFTEKVKNNLDEKFMEGERTKRKFDPKKIAEMMERETIGLAAWNNQENQTARTAPRTT